jgi:regulatory protein
MVITEISNCKRNKNRVNIYVDGSFAFALYLETAAWAGLSEGMDATGLDLKQIALEDEKKYAMDIALSYLSYRMRTQKEVRDKLRQKEVGEEAADYVIQRLQEAGYINDREFAAVYAEELKERLGKRGIRQKLYEKGIRDGEADETLAGLGGFEDTVRSHAERLLDKYKNDDAYKARSKVFRALLNRGFDADEIKSALAELGAGVEE